MKKVAAFFDGDVVAYRAGFAAEKRYYFDSRNPPESGGMTWDYKKEAVKHVEEQYLEFGRKLEPIENALQNEISKPGRRVYSRATSIPKVMNGLGLAILSTPKGVMSDTEARKNNIGGEVICRVF